MTRGEALRRVTRRRPCAVCSKHDYCGFSADGRLAVCMRVESAEPSKNGGFIHRFSEASDRPQPRPRPVVHQHERASVEHADSIYSTLIRGHLVLAQEHRGKLNRRGLSDEEIEHNGYRSVPTFAYGKSVARALSQHDLRGVPGFYRLSGSWLMSAPGPGILIPVRDTQLKIRGFQVRLDEGPTRYKWFSSANKPEGASSGAPVHFAHPERIRGQGRAFITEGALKADVIAALTGAGCIGLAGVTTFPGGFGRKLRKALPGVREIFVAFDSDFRTNPHVSRALFRLIRELRFARLAVEVFTWSGEFKGFDDYLKGRLAA